MGERGQAYIGKVVLVEPIENADKIERLDVVCGGGGKWSAVARVGEFSDGELVEVYLQDSLLPNEPRFHFMDKHDFRVRMVRLRGVPSEVLVMPISPKIRVFDVGVGDDITRVAGVERYEKPLPARIGGNIVGLFPMHIPKTDEPNFQAVPKLVAALRGQQFVSTVKADGTSTTAYIDRDGVFRVCSRNYTVAEDDTNTLWGVARKYKVEEALHKDGMRNIALQWETVGPGIQKNPLGLKSTEMRLFDAYDFDQHTYLHPFQLRRLSEEHGLRMADIVDSQETFRMDDEQLRKYAEGLYCGTKRQREGVVIRPFVNQVIDGDRLSFKVINLRYKEA